MQGFEIKTDIRQSISTDLAWRYKIIPKSVTDKSVTLLTSTDHCKDMKKELEILSGKKVDFEYVSDETIDDLLARYYRRSNAEITKTSLPGSDDFFDFLINESIAFESSDIHMEIFDGRCRVRIRIDGVLQERYILKESQFKSWVNKIKVKAGLDIAEKRLPQDGRICYDGDSDKFDVRVSILPTIYGEKVVLRLLYKNPDSLSLNSLGFSELQHRIYSSNIKKPFGLILICGPTGSGKTTTLYSSLRVLNKESRNILTIEDPVEYTIDGINQVQVKENIGFTFASGLRVFLRQDPDIIMVGEIRDKETAQLAVRASLTGHLVLSTIHTNSAIGIVDRLIDMDIPPYLIASVLNISVAQRLVRKLCTFCKEEQGDSTYKAVGCKECHFTGYSGRIAIFEVFSPGNNDRATIRDVSMNEKTYKIDQTLKDSALALVRSGITSKEEVEPIINMVL